MKANAPEEIYLLPDDRNPNGLSICWYEVPYRTGAIEYTRTDTFIEKALKWYCLDCECNDNCNADYKCFFRQEYKRYLEGNNNAIPPKFDNAINPDGSLTENYRYRHFIRKVRDTFIEKAYEWLKTHYRDYMHNPTGKRLEAFFGGDMCNDFEDYMKGE